MSAALVDRLQLRWSIERWSRVGFVLAGAPMASRSLDGRAGRAYCSSYDYYYCCYYYYYYDLLLILLPLLLLLLLLPRPQAYAVWGITTVTIAIFIATTSYLLTELMLLRLLRLLPLLLLL